MLAGRKLLLADDSITIQKVVDLTFADEGVKVFSVGNGLDAVEILDQVTPDIILADVHMPEIGGYELCEYIKQNEKLKHIPVMLLVGSFEPFDEAEARRVGADDILTKPFQSIRKLIEKVGGLVSGRQPQEEVRTAELPKVEPEEEPAHLSTQEIEVTTADTRPLRAEFEGATANPLAATSASIPEAPIKTEKMEPSMSGPDNGSAMTAEVADELLDLGDIEVAEVSDEEFVLDLAFSDEDEPALAEAAAGSGRVFVEPEVTPAREFEASYGEISEPQYEPIAEQFATTQEIPTAAFDEEPAMHYQEVEYGYSEPTPESSLIRVTDDVEPTRAQTASRAIDASSLSPEMIDAIARRVVEQMSDKVVQEIAWEVVPQLAELMIKRQLEEKKS